MDVALSSKTIWFVLGEQIFDSRSIFLNQLLLQRKVVYHFFLYISWFDISFNKELQLPRIGLQSFEYSYTTYCYLNY